MTVAPLPSMATLLRLHRRRAGLTQEALAEQAGFSSEYIKKIEAGLRRPSRASLEVLAEALDLDAKERERFRSARNAVDVGTTSKSSPQNRSLPAPISSFVGRSAQLSELRSLLLEAHTRLITLVGPGGSGKTRLAIQLAHDVSAAFPDGAFLVELASIVDPSGAAPAIRTTVGAPDGPEGDLEAAQTWIGSRRVLLVIDNLEHLLGASRDVLHLLTSCPSLTVIVTSRVQLRVPGERVYDVPPMTLPEVAVHLDIDQLKRSEAVSLFVSRAKEARNDFDLSATNAEAISAICRRLDGLPLAIELAAASIRMFRPHQLLARLEAGLLTVPGSDERSSLPDRQQSLRRTMDWSYNLLDPDAAQALRQASVFTSGFTLEALTHTCGYDDPALAVTALQVLIESSLIREHEGFDSDSRYSMLEMIREFAGGQLTREEVRDARNGHARYFLTLAQSIYPDLNSVRRSSGLDRLESERENIVTAIEWLTESGDRSNASALAGLVWPLWHDRGFRNQGRTTIAKALGPPGQDEPNDIRALRGAAVLEIQMGESSEAEDLLLRALHLARRLKDPVELTHTLRALSGLAEARDDAAGMMTYAREAFVIAVQSDDPSLIARTASDVGVGLLASRKPEEAQQYVEQSIDAGRRAGLQDLLIISLGNLSWLLTKKGDQGRAETYAREAYSIGVTEGGSWPRGVAALNLGGILIGSSPRDGAKHLREALTKFQELDDVEDQLSVCELLAKGLAISGEESLAAQIWGATDALRNSMKMPGLSDNRSYWTDTLNSAREQADPVVWDEAWTRGESMTLEELTATALSAPV